MATTPSPRAISTSVPRNSASSSPSRGFLAFMFGPCVERLLSRWEKGKQFPDLLAPRHSPVLADLERLRVLDLPRSVGTVPAHELKVEAFGRVGEAALELAADLLLAGGDRGGVARVRHQF